MPEKSEKLDPRQFSEIYSAFIEAAQLTDEDRQLLKTKRGFTDDMIEELRLRSTSEDNVRIITALQFKYGMQLAKDSGIWFGQGANRKLTEPGNIIIPYIEGDKVVSLRPHKNALKGLTLPFYLPAGKPLKPGLCILAESEFKAAAAVQLGYQAVGIAGISAAARTHYQALVDLLKTSGVTSLCVIFDNEDKGNPAFANYKRHFWDRYDTQFFAYYMAEKLAFDGVEATIATLPAKWMVDGKIDIDGALAMGKAHADMVSVIDERLSPEDYLKSLPQDVRVLIRRRWEKMFIQFPVRIEHNCYLVTKGDPPVDTPVSNFVFSIDNNIYSADGDCRREVTLKSRVGDVYPKQLFEGRHLSHAPAFAARAMSIASLQFTGTQKDLEAVVGFESAREIGKRTFQPDHCGWISVADMFLFENGGVSAKGERLPADEESVVWNGLTGWQAVPLVQGGDKSAGLPSLAPEDMDPGMLIDLIEKNFSGDLEIRLACAWGLACLVSHWVAPAFGGAFPILFVQGQAQAGKSTLAKWISAMAGMRTEGFSYPAGTLVGAQRGLAFYSSLPFWMDEFRNSTRHTDKEGMLRSAYDGQGALKGLRQGFGVRANTIRGRVMISGQDTPHDIALQQRCVTVRIKETMRLADAGLYNRLNELVPAMSGVIPVIVRRFAERRQKVFDAITVARNAIRKAGMDDRTAITYAIPMGVYDGIVREDHAEFLSFALNHAKQAFNTKEDEKPPHLFLDGIATLMSRGILNGNAVRATGGLLAIDVGPAYQAWREVIRRTGDDFAFKQVTLINEFEEIAGFVERERNVKFGSSQRKCLILDPCKDERIRMLYDRVVGYEEGN